MSKEVLVTCPNCGLPLTAEHRKGNLMRCPACKTIFEIKLKTSQGLGKCPYGCGETIRVEDYIDDMRVQCVHCHGISVVRTPISNKPWNAAEENAPILYKYLGRCPDCQEWIGDSDRDLSGNLICPTCKMPLVERAEYIVSEKIGVCPICDNPLGKCDIGIDDKCYCEDCKQIFILDHVSRHIPTGNLFSSPTLSAYDFKLKCFELLFDNSPSDIASKLEIQQEKLSFEPAKKDHFCAMDHPETFRFNKKENTPIIEKFGGQVEFPSDIDSSVQGNRRCYLPKYELSYKYRDQMGRFWMKEGESEIHSENMPESERLKSKYWITDKELYSILLVIFIAGIVWWWNSTNGFFSGLWNLILLVIFIIIIFFIVVGPGLTALTHIMRTRCQKRKVEEFQSMHGVDYSERRKK